MRRHSRSDRPPSLHRPLMAEFWVGIETLRTGDLRETRANHLGFCIDRLRSLESNRAAALDGETPYINAEAAIVRCFMAGDCLFPDGREIEAIEQGEVAVREALASDNHAVIYDCLTNLGSWYLFTGADDKAITCFQRAIAFAYEPGKHTQAKHSEVLRLLGGIWARSPETLALARLTAQWRRALQPHSVEPWRDEFNWLIQLRQESDVEAVATAGAGETCEEAACHLAALLALGRYSDALGAAREGRSRALAQGAHEWSRAFDRVLVPTGPTIQGR